MRPETNNDCAGEDQQHFNRLTGLQAVSTSQQQRAVASEGQMQLGVNGQEL
jgi:hypothetical protein